MAFGQNEVTVQQLAMLNTAAANATVGTIVQQAVGQRRH